MHVDEAKAHLRVSGTDDNTYIAGLVRAARMFVEQYSGHALVTAQYRMSRSTIEELELPWAPLQSITSATYVDSGGTTQTVGTSIYTTDTYAMPGKFLLAYNQTWPTVRGDNNCVTILYKAGWMTPFTAVAATDVCTAQGRTFTDGDRVRVYNSGGALPTGLAASTDYYVRDASGSTFKLSATSGGAAVDITAAGTGTHFIGEPPHNLIHAMKFLIAHWYEHREAVSEIPSNETELAMRALLWQDRLTCSW